MNCENDGEKGREVKKGNKKHLTNLIIHVKIIPAIDDS